MPANAMAAVELGELEEMCHGFCLVRVEGVLGFGFLGGAHIKCLVRVEGDFAFGCFGEVAYAGIMCGL